MAQLYASSAHHDAHKPSPYPLIVCCPCMFHRKVSRVNSTCSILLLVARDSIFLHSSLLHCCRHSLIQRWLQRCRTTGSVVDDRNVWLAGALKASCLYAVCKYCYTTYGTLLLIVRTWIPAECSPQRAKCYSRLPQDNLTEVEYKNDSF